MPAKADLSGMTVMVTRPAHQARPLCEMIESRSGHVICFPVLEIADIADRGPVEALVGRLHEYDLAVFVSVNAAAKGLPLVLARGPWPRHTRVAAVGERTAGELARFGVPVDICPATGFDSESLLAVRELQAAGGKRVLIFRGRGGRELLADTLRGRGAHVDYAEVYRRVRPDAELGEVLRQHPFPDAIVITSGEGLENLYHMTGSELRPRLLATPLVVVSARIADKARALGFTQPPAVAGHAGDRAVVEAIEHWWAGKKKAQRKLQ